MAFIHVTVPTPHEHPGWKDYFFVSSGEHHNWLDYYKNNISAEPTRGQAWDAEKRLAHARWKADFVEWLKVQDGIRPMVFIKM